MTKPAAKRNEGGAKKGVDRKADDGGEKAELVPLGEVRLHLP